MKPINLTNVIKPYQSGWIAINKNYKVAAWAKTFEAIVPKVKKSKNTFLIPASKNYFGFVT